VGGGPRDFDINPETLRRLEDRAKEALRQAQTRRNVFISYSFDDTDTVNALRAQAANDASDLQFNDRSQKEPYDSISAEYIRRGLRELIRNCSVTLVYVSDATATSRWVDWEVRESVGQGKKVVAVYSGAAPPAHLPAAIREHNIPVRRWTHESLMRELR